MKETACDCYSKYDHLSARGSNVWTPLANYVTFFSMAGYELIAFRFLLTFLSLVNFFLLFDMFIFGDSWLYEIIVGLHIILKSIVSSLLNNIIPGQMIT